MERIEGESLAERLARGTLHRSEAILYAVQIASALDEAHRQGVVHRDLKPGNVMIARSGVKLLDFGLARVRDNTSNDESVTGSHTVLGTLAYMAPEQLDGNPADARSDIFSFGSVLYEMITGRQAFAGENSTQVALFITSRDPEPVGEAGDRLAHVVRRCLMKDPEERWQTARDLMLELEWIGEDPDSRPARASAVKTRYGRWTLWAAAAALACLVFFPSLLRRQSPMQPVTRFQFAAPGQTQVGSFAISPDGRRLVLSARDDNGTRLWIRPLEALTATPLAGSEGVELDNPPFWSPDGRNIGFFAGGSLKRIDTARGIARTLCAAPQARGGAWADDTILFSPAVRGGLFKVSASGGNVTPVTELKKDDAEVNHRVPSFLPDGKHFLYLSQAAAGASGIYLGKLGSRTVARLTDANSAAVYASGHLLYLRGDKLFAHTFDLGTLRLSGEAQVVAAPVGGTRVIGAMRVSASQSGALVYAPASRAGSGQLLWLDRTGKQTPATPVGPFAALSHLGFSSDGKRLVLDRGQVQSRGRDVWLLEFAGNVWSQLTFHPGNDWVPSWSPDGRTIAFTSDRDGPSGLHQIFVKAADGTGGERLIFTSGEDKHHLTWSPDGASLVFESMTSATNSDLWLLPLVPGSQPRPLAVTNTNEIQPSFAPNGRWLAYASNESGRFEIFVQALQVGGGRFQVSTGGGVQPVWRQDGAEMYFLAPDGKLMAVDVRPQHGTFEAGAPRALFATGLRGNDSQSHFAAAGDGSRFLIYAEIPDPSAQQMTVVLNWTSSLRR